MKYSVRKVPAGTTSAIEGDAWEVLKTPQSGDPYIIATFHHPSLARWAVSSFRSSMEVQRWGGSVEDSKLWMVEESIPMPTDMPDELVW